MNEGRTDPAARAAFLTTEEPIRGGGKHLTFVFERTTLDVPRLQMTIALVTEGPIELIAQSFEHVAAELRKVRDELDAGMR